MIFMVDGIYRWYVKHVNSQKPVEAVFTLDDTLRRRIRRTMPTNVSKVAFTSELQATQYLEKYGRIAIPDVANYDDSDKVKFSVYSATVQKLSPCTYALCNNRLHSVIVLDLIPDSFDVYMDE